MYSSQQHGYTRAFGYNVGPIVRIKGEPCRISGENPDGTVTFVSTKSGRHIEIDENKFSIMLYDGDLVPNAGADLSKKSEISVKVAPLMETHAGTSYMAIADYRNTFVKRILEIPRGERHLAIEDGILQKIHQEYLEANDHPRWLKRRAVPGRASVYRWLRIAEQEPDARRLLPEFHRCGARGPRFNPIIESWISELIEEMYFNAKEAQLTAAAVSIHREVRNRIKNSTTLEHLRTPSIGTVVRRITAHGGERRLEHEMGKRQSRMHYKHVEAGPNLILPMARWEIDHTRVDVFVLDDETKQVIGRPYLTVVIDHTTRMIAGYLLTVEAPNAADVLAALREAMLPKLPEALAALGVKRGWPVFGVPKELGVDRGRDFLSHAVCHACQALSIDLTAMPPRTPQMKGRVERFFGTLNTLLFHQLAGTTKSDAKAKGDRKPEQEARVTFQELNAFIARTICDLYHHTRHSELGCSPAEKWNELTKKFEGPKVFSGPEILDATLLSQNVKVTRHGIKIKGIRYSSAAISKIRSMAHAHARSNPKIEILRDPDDISRIYCKEQGSTRLIEIPAITPTNLQGVSMRMLALIRRRRLDAQSHINGETLNADAEDLRNDVRKTNRRKAPKILSNSTSSSKPTLISVEGVQTRVAKSHPVIRRKTVNKRHAGTPASLPELKIKSIDD